MKLFDIWNRIKKQTESKGRPEYSEGDVWMCRLGENVGVEEDGKGDQFLRPVLVLKKFNKEFCFIVPLSTTSKRGRYYAMFRFKNSESVCLVSHARSVDCKRFLYKMGSAPKETVSDIKEKTRDMLT
jgi:mRNA interferase MazF